MCEFPFDLICGFFYCHRLVGKVITYCRRYGVQRYNRTCSVKRKRPAFKTKRSEKRPAFKTKRYEQSARKGHWPGLLLIHTGFGSWFSSKLVRAPRLQPPQGAMHCGINCYRATALRLLAQCQAACVGGSQGYYVYVFGDPGNTMVLSATYPLRSAELFSVRTPVPWLCPMNYGEYTFRLESQPPFSTAALCQIPVRKKFDRLATFHMHDLPIHRPSVFVFLLVEHFPF